jgi:hypothetical protein
MSSLSASDKIERLFTGLMVNSMTCRNQLEWDTAADLPDDLPDAVCHDCGKQYNREYAIFLNGKCDACNGILIPDTETDQ